MDISGDHALLSRGDPISTGFYLRLHMVQQSLGIILRRAWIHHVVESHHIRLAPSDSPRVSPDSCAPRHPPLIFHGDSTFGLDLDVTLLCYLPTVVGEMLPRTHLTI